MWRMQQKCGGQEDVYGGSVWRMQQKCGGQEDIGRQCVAHAAEV